jgi:hypothetical protein
VSACGGHLDGPFHMMLTFDLAEIEFLLGGPGCVPVVRRSNRLEDIFAANKLYDLREP